jgi:tRNA pseudouridine38-40 synthase
MKATADSPQTLRAVTATVLLRVGYDGTDLHGFAPQHNARTVAGELLRAVQTLDDQVTVLRGASRTDAGVHARDQIVAFDATRNIATKGWALGINSNLPRDISVHSASYCAAGFEPRFGNVGKRYCYRIVTSKVRRSLEERNAWRVEADLDIDAMQREAEAFVGMHDFRAFHTEDKRAPKLNTSRTVRELNITQREQHALDIEVRGDAFLYNMVRIMVGTLVDVGAQRRAPGTAKSALLSKLRVDAGATAPAHGLTLEEIELKPDAALRDTFPGQ